MIRPNSFLRPALTAASLLALGLAACQEKADPPSPAAATDVAATPAASAAKADGEHHGDAPQTLEEARAQGHREGMEMERDAHERGMEMGAEAHADGMKAAGADAAPMKKADPPMKMDGHM
jgi:hypothetical protein